MELDLGWSGICIEPHPGVFPKLQQNRNCKLINCCVSEINDEIEFLVLEGYTEMLSGIHSEYDPKHLERINNELSYYGGTSTVVKVQSRTLTSILDEHKITAVDYLSIDVEGGELSVLKSLNLNKFNVYVISIENNGYSNDIREYLESNGYKYLTKIACDEIYEKSR
jgi:FkbM family methyltransferase